MLDIPTIRKGLDSMVTEILANKDRLNELDGAIGDADFGTTVAGAFAALQKGLDDLEAGATSPGELIRKTGMLLMRNQGGASGPLFGTAFREAGKTAGEAAELDAPTMAAMLEAALAGIMRLGKSAPGDKTLVDALDPATKAFRERADAGASLSACAAAAAIGAQVGAEATKQMVASRGRAHYVGERSLGHPDAGAVAVSLLFGLFPLKD